MPTPHNNAPQGAYATTVLMPGDPLRAKYVAETFLTNVQLVNSVRNSFGYTGYYNGVRLSIQASGMGMPSMGIYAYELYKYYGVKNIIRIGSAGSYTPALQLLDVVLADRSYTESTYARTFDGVDTNVALPSAALNELILRTAKEEKIPCKLANIHSSDVFYKELPSNDSSTTNGCGCVEMESFALFHIAKHLHTHAACLLTISDAIWTARQLSADERQQSLNDMILLALRAATLTDSTP